MRHVGGFSHWRSAIYLGVSFVEGRVVPSEKETDRCWNIPAPQSSTTPHGRLLKYGGWVACWVFRTCHSTKESLVGCTQRNLDGMLQVSHADRIAKGFLKTSESTLLLGKSGEFFRVLPTASLVTLAAVATRNTTNHWNPKGGHGP